MVTENTKFRTEVEKKEMLSFHHTCKPVCPVMFICYQYYKIGNAFRVSWQEYGGKVLASWEPESLFEDNKDVAQNKHPNVQTNKNKEENANLNTAFGQMGIFLA